METLMFVLPILPGKEAIDRETIARISAPGPERDAYMAARRAQGITREMVWHQVTPDGTLAIVHLEGDDVMRSLQGMATSDDPVDRRFRDFVKEVHGVDLANDPPPDVRLIADTQF